MKDVRHLIALNGKDSLLKSSGKLSGISYLDSKKKKKKRKENFTIFQITPFLIHLRLYFP